MKPLLALLGTLLSLSVASAQPAPKGLPPSLYVVHEPPQPGPAPKQMPVDPGEAPAPPQPPPRVPAKGEITLRRAQLLFKQVERVEKVIDNGKEVIVKRTVHVPVLMEHAIACDISRCRVITANGKKLANDEAIKRLTPNTVVAVSPNGQTPDGPYLRALNADTLVIVLPAGQGEILPHPLAVPPAMVPPSPPEKRLPKAP